MLADPLEPLNTWTKWPFSLKFWPSFACMHMVIAWGVTVGMCLFSLTRTARGIARTFKFANKNICLVMPVEHSTAFIGHWLHCSYCLFFGVSLKIGLMGWGWCHTEWKQKAFLIVQVNVQSPLYLPYALSLLWHCQHQCIKYWHIIYT